MNFRDFDVKLQRHTDHKFQQIAETPSAVKHLTCSGRCFFRHSIYGLQHRVAMILQRFFTPLVCSIYIRGRRR